MAHEPVRNDTESGDTEQRSETGSDGRGPSVSRRDYFRLGAAAATATAVGAGLLGGASASTAGSHVTFDRVVNAVDDLGCDPTGNEPIESRVDDAATPGTCIEFSDGEYLVGSYLNLRGVTNVGLRAADGASPTLRPGTRGADLPGGFLFIRLEGSDIEFGGFDVDFGRDGYYGEIICDATDGDLHVHDIRRLGLVPGDIDGIWLTNESADGVGLVERVRMRDGAREGYSATGLQVRPSHAGELHIVDCELWHFPSKGIYASTPAATNGAGGTVHVEGGLFKNNNDCDVRIGSPGSTVRNIVSVKEDTRQGETVTWKDPIPRRYWDGRRDIVQTRSIRLKNGSDVLVEGCEFDHRIGRGTAVITAEGSHAGGTTIRDCRINVTDADIYPILLRDGDHGPYSIENVSITGTGGRGTAILVQDGNDGTVVRNSCIQLSAAGEDGIEFAGARNCSVTDTNVHVYGDAVVFTNTTGETSDLTYGDSCPLPNTDGSGGSDGGSAGGSDDGSTELPNRLDVRGTGVATNYTFTADGEVAGVTDSLEDWDTISGSTVEGWVTTAEHVDSYRFSEGVASFEHVEGETALALNGEPVTVEELLAFPDPAGDGSSDDGSSGDDSLARRVEIRGTGTATNYVLVVDGEVTSGADDTLEEWDTIDGAVVRGWVTTSEHVDTYQFSGDVVYLGFYEGSAAVTVDGTTVDPADFGYEHTLVVDGYGAETATYGVEVDGNVAPDPVAGDLAASGPLGTRVDESVVDGTHSYVYTGDLTGFSLDGDAAVYVDGEQVDPTALADGTVSALPNVLVFDGTAGDSPTEYAFSVTGPVYRSTDLGSAELLDTVESGRVSGSVDGDADGYRFAGDVTSLSVDGTGSVRFEDTDG